MKQNRISYRLRDLSLYMKMLLIITFACCVLLVGNYAVLQMVYHSYDEQLYIKTAQVFTSYVEQVETEFEKINTVTLSMLGDEGVQRNMTILYEEEPGSAKWLVAKSELGSQVGSYLYNVSAFTNFGIYTSGGTVIENVGNLSSEDKKKLADMAVEGKGQSRIVMYQNKLYFLRQIRESKGFAFTNLGAMIGEINIQKILDKCGETYRDAGIDLNLSVYVEDSCIYQKDELAKPLEKDGWAIQNDSFVVQCTTDRGWKFLIYTSYVRE